MAHSRAHWVRLAAEEADELTTNWDMGNLEIEHIPKNPYDQVDEAIRYVEAQGGPSLEVSEVYVELDRRKRHRARANPGLSPAMRQRAKDFRTFHDFDFKEISENSRLNVPKTIPVVGSCDYVLYRSDKWHDGTHEYIHDITSKPSVVLGIVGADNGKPTRVPQRIQGIQGVSLIGKCLGVGYIDWDNEPVEMGVRGSCEWWWSQKARALFIIENKRKIIAIVWGGKLNVLSKGIVG